MNIQDAAHRIGHEYPGGAVALAHRIGINPTVFNSKLNPNNLTHHLTLAEAQRMQLLTGRTDILEAMASELGYVIMHRPGTMDGCDACGVVARKAHVAGQCGLVHLDFMAMGLQALHAATESGFVAHRAGGGKNVDVGHVFELNRAGAMPLPKTADC